jgi:hypothetical protein
MNNDLRDRCIEAAAEQYHDHYEPGPYRDMRPDRRELWRKMVERAVDAVLGEVADHAEAEYGGDGMELAFELRGGK